MQYLFNAGFHNFQDSSSKFSSMDKFSLIWKQFLRLEVFGIHFTLTTSLIWGVGSLKLIKIYFRISFKLIIFKVPTYAIEKIWLNQWNFCKLNNEFFFHTINIMFGWINERIYIIQQKMVCFFTICLDGTIIFS